MPSTLLLAVLAIICYSYLGVSLAIVSPSPNGSIGGGGRMAAILWMSKLPDASHHVIFQPFRHLYRLRHIDSLPAIFSILHSSRHFLNFMSLTFIDHDTSTSPPPPNTLLLLGVLTIYDLNRTITTHRDKRQQPTNTSVDTTCVVTKQGWSTGIIKENYSRLEKSTAKQLIEVH